MNENLKQVLKDEIRKYLKENVEDFAQRSSDAWDKIDKWRAPLSQCDGGLERNIIDYVEEWFWNEFITEDFLI